MIEVIFIAIISFIVLAFLAFIGLLMVRQRLVNRHYLPHQVFLVRLPKEKKSEGSSAPVDNINTLREEIAKGETIFTALGSLRSKRSLSRWLHGRSDQFSFEIFSKNNRIGFYVVAPPEGSRFLEQQIHAHYPDAVIEEVDDYNPFTPNFQTSAAYLRTIRPFIFPIKTYQKIEVDPLNSIINALSKLEKDESLVVQYVVSSSHRSWHRLAKRVVHKINQKNSVAAGLSIVSFWGRLANMFTELFNTFSKPKTHDTNNTRLSAMEDEMVKSIEAKASKMGLDVNIRLVACAETRDQADTLLDNLGTAFMEFNNSTYGNAFSRLDKSKQGEIIRDFSYRYFCERRGFFHPESFLLNSEELTSIFHFPLKNTETPNIVWLAAKIAPAPADIPEQGISLGVNMYRNVKKEVRIKKEDRRRHTYIIGKSGVGKSVLLANMAVQDIQNGEGICVMDPHGDLITDIINRIPPERIDDVVVFSPGDISRPLGLNLLEYDERYPEQKTFVINEMIGIFDKLYDLKATGGPMFEQYMRNAMLLIMDDPASGSTLMEIPKVLADEDFRKMKISRCKNKTVIDFWINEAQKAGGDAALANVVPYVTSKLTSFISNDMMRPIIGQQKSAFNMREIMDSQKILLVDLPKGRVGELNAYLLGMIIVGKVLMAALSRTDILAADRKDFYLYIDEFQNFTTNSICQILSEARKYALNLIIAHQYIGQLSKNNNTEIKDAVFGNVGTMISFKIGSDDSEFLVKEFGPVFNQFDLINVDKGSAYIKLLIDNSASRPFSMRTIWPLVGNSNPALGEKARALSRLKYGQDSRLVELGIEARSKKSL